MGNKASNGFGAKTTAEEAARDADLSGKLAIVTGANSGIGVETARVLVLRGARVIMACRNMEKGKAALDEIQVAAPESNLSLKQLDLGSLASVRAFAKEVNEEEEKIDILVNNAGIMATPYGETMDGIEQQFGVNHVGHFLLTTLLLDRIKAAAPSRIVILASSAHNASDIRYGDLSGKGTWNTGVLGRGRAYGQSKTANVLFAVGLTERLAGTGVTANAVHPGVINTNLGQHLGPMQLFIGPATAIFGKTVAQGAATSIYCATAPELAEVSGLYFQDCNVGKPKPYALDKENAEKLWKVTEETIAAADERAANAPAPEEVKEDVEAGAQVAAEVEAEADKGDEAEAGAEAERAEAVKEAEAAQEDETDTEIVKEVEADEEDVDEAQVDKESEAEANKNAEAEDKSEDQQAVEGSPEELDVSEKEVEVERLTM